MSETITRASIYSAIFLSLLMVPLSAISPASANFEDRAEDADYRHLRGEWPITDFETASIPVTEIQSGGPPRDGIRSIDDPKFIPARLIRDISDTEPVISVQLGGDIKAYPFRILMQHEIVNDIVGGLSIAVTYCPLCNSAFVFERRIDGRTVEFGTTGRLYNSNMVMYDRWTESWWTQFTGKAIIGKLTGTQLHRLPARIESFAKFRDRHPMGDVLAPPDNPRRSYGLNPYYGYDSRRQPWFQVAELPKGISAMARLVTVGDRAWSLRYVRKRGPIETDDGLVISWESGQNSALDTRRIDEGRDVGNVLVQQKTPDGLLDVAYGVDFAFAFRSFYPDSVIVTK